MMSYLHYFTNTNLSKKLKFGKKLFFGLILTIVPFITMAQSLELELIRTKQVPGFFAVRIFPDSNLKQIDIEDIFVKNFTTTEAKNFTELIPILEELGGRVIEKEDIKEYMLPYNRIILLGGNRVNNFIHFIPKDKNNVLSEFDSFAEENLKSPILLNISATFGGNITDVYPAMFTSMSDDPIFFVGKFNKEIKTKMEITALTSEGEIVAITPLNLNIFEENEFSQSLPEIWEEVYNAQLPQKESHNISPLLISLFPWILGFLGIITIIFAISIGTRFTPPIKYQYKKNRKKDLSHNLDDVPEGFWHQPKEKVDEALPFEITPRPPTRDS